MKKMKKFVTMLLMLLMIAVMLPVTASAAAKKTITVTASNAKITSNKLSLTATGTSTLTVKYGGKKVAAQKAAYKSSKTAVAAVSKKGVINAKKAGKTVITVKYKGLTKKLNLTVTKPSITVKAGSSTVSQSKFTTNIGKKTQMQLILGYKNSGAKKVTSKVIAPAKVKWTSSNTRAATVSKNGVVTAKKAGKTVIKMIYGSVSKSVTVTVSKKHVHNWKAITTRRWVVDTDGWTEKIKIGEEFHCTCGINFGSDWNAYDTHRWEKIEQGESGHSYGVVPIYETIYHEPTGHYETTITGYKCSTCGATK